MEVEWARRTKQGAAAARLCLEETELRKSHVLSEFLYEPTYERFDPKQPKQGRMLKVPANTDELLSHLQKGLRERLLCGVCEQYLNQIGEQYASKVLKRMDETEISTGERNSIVTGVEYSPFKLFLMTQLWRAGVALDAFWKDVRLGPHEERLREMLLRTYPGQPYEYACVISRIRDPGDLAGDLASRAVVQPIAKKIGGTYLVRLCRSGLLLAIYSFEPLKGSLRSPFHPLRERRATTNFRCHCLHRVEVRRDKPMGKGASSVFEKASSRQLT